MKVHEHVQQLECAPGVPFHNVPTGFFEESEMLDETEDYEGSDSHITKRLESLIQKRENLYM